MSTGVGEVQSGILLVLKTGVPWNIYGVNSFVVAA